MCRRARVKSWPRSKWNEIDKVFFVYFWVIEHTRALYNILVIAPTWRARCVALWDTRAMRAARYICICGCDLGRPLSHWERDSKRSAPRGVIGYGTNLSKSFWEIRVGVLGIGFGTEKKNCKPGTCFISRRKHIIYIYIKFMTKFRLNKETKFWVNVETIFGVRLL